MDILVNWVTQIVVFLIFASIIDLLLPANTMKKYIQFVIGLILILIFLKPVLYLFDIDIKEVVETSLTSMNQQDTDTQTMDDLIKMQKSEIESSQDAYILKETVVQLQELAADPLAKNFQLSISDIQFVFEPEEQVIWENLQTVVVYLSEQSEEEDAVDDIEDVTIDTDERPSQKQEEEANEDIEEMLQDIWEMDDTEIIVIQEGGTS